jgi:hypothetical protein
MQYLTRLEVKHPRTDGRWFAIATSFGAIAGVVAFLVPACGDSGPGGGCAIDGKACGTACDASLGCVECAADGDCGAARPFCVTGHCEVCAVSADCGAGQACFLGDNTCHPACTSNASCTDPKAAICNLDTGACVECVVPDTCAGGEPICDPSHGTCAECASDGDCGAAAPVCDLSDGRCRECVVDGQCPDGGLCHDHHCKAVCQGDSDCGGAKPFCAPSGECVECVLPADCPAVAPFCNAHNDCSECNVAADCANPALPFCFDAEQCVQCLDKEDCPATMKCKDHVCAN